MRERRIKEEENGGVYHCMSRITQGEWWMDEASKERLRRQMRRAADFCGVKVLTYCLMSNHFHMLVETPSRKEREAVSNEELVRRVGVLYGESSQEVEEVSRAFRDGGKEGERWRERLKERMGDVSMFMKEVKQRFTMYHNGRYGKVGTVWAERFKSVLVERGERTVGMMAAYIDLNPVRAGICKDPKEYRWSGYGEAVGGGGQEARGGIKAVSGHEQWEAAHGEYRKWMYGIGEGSRGGKRCFSQEEVGRVSGLDGRLRLEELVRLRVKYLVEGGILGSREYIERWYRAHRGERKLKREFGSRRMKGGEWGELRVFRDPRGRLIGNSDDSQPE